MSDMEGSVAASLDVPQRSRFVWLAPLLLCPAFLWGCWSAPFLPVDDVEQIYHNPSVQPDAPWSEIWTGWKEKDVDCFWLPLTDTSFRVDRVIYEPLLGRSLGNDRAWAAGVRINSVLLHMLVGVLVFMLARHFGFSVPWAGAVAALSTIHPIHCNTVCWCVERKTILAAVFGYGALLVYLRARNWRWHALAVGLYACALLSKAAALGLLPVVIVLELFRLARWDAGAERDTPELPAPAAKRIGFAVLRLIPWGALSVAALLINLHFVKEATLPPPGGSLWTAALTDVGVLWRHVLNLLVPLWLSFDYALPVVVSLADPRLWLYALGLAAVVLATALLAERGKRKFVCLLWLWFVGAMGPALNFVGKNNLTSDCYVYFSVPAFWMAIAAALQGAVARLQARQVRIPRGLGPAALLVVLALLTAGIARRSRDYAGGLQLFEAAARAEPKSAMNQLLLAQYLYLEAQAELARGNKAAAAAHLERRMQAFEASVEGVNFDRTLMMSFVYANLGECYYAKGRLDRAEAALQQALVTPPPLGGPLLAQVYAHLALTAGDRKDYRQALDRWNAAIQVAPDRPKYRLLRAKVLAALQQRAATPAQAITYYAAAKADLESIGPDEATYPQAVEFLKQLRPPN
jgi:tetratricopeptide (TPR) repeat protein